MTLSAGGQLGTYEILLPIGAGGMGEVYRARDPRLDRDVALKILPDSLAHDPERVLRFQREAKLLASLDHPNIASIHGFEEANDKWFLVLELVEGETLAQRLESGAFAVEDALGVAKQMAEALEAAHKKGVIHRDLKPGNVMVRPDGTVKVLDFGLAKVLTDDSGTVGATADSPTITADYTKPGLVLGTAPYMSPEQARGKPLDKRTDIWSFGVILYECLTGRMLFRGESTTDTIGAIIHKEPDWTALPPHTPPTIHLLLRRCLTKDRNNRLHDIADARVEIQDVLSAESAGEAVLAPQTTSGVSRRAFGVSLAATIVLAVSTLIFAWLATRPESVTPTPVVNLSVVNDSTDPIPPLAYLSGPVLAISPDGSRLAFLGMEHGQTKLFLRELSEVESRALPGTEGALAPFFSPDGRHVGFMSRGMLKTIAVDGATPRDVCPAPGLRGACWTERDEIVFSAGSTSALARVPASGGVPQPLTHLNRAEREISHRFPEPLPGGRFVLLLIRRGEALSYGYQVGLVDLDTGDYHVLIEEELGHARYAGGLLLCSRRDGSVDAVRFDLKKMRTIGSPTAVLAGVRSLSLTGTSHLAIAQNGTLVYLPGKADTVLGRVVWLDRDGNVTRALPTKRRFTVPRLSPDGRYLSVGITDTGPDLWRYDLKHNPPTRLRLTRDGVSVMSLWSPDNQWIGFASERTGTFQMYRVSADGSGEAQVIQSSKNAQLPLSWSPDGRFIAYEEHRPETGYDVWIKPLDEGSQPWPVAHESYDELEPTFSPDSKWLAYVSTESGTQEILVQAVAGGGARHPVSAGGGTNPLWRGNEIFYRRGEELMVVKVTTEPGFSTEAAISLFQGLSNTFIPARMFDVDHSGQRIIAALPESDSVRSYREIRVVTGWVEQVHRRLTRDD